jgi:hypothetical protein
MGLGRIKFSLIAAKKRIFLRKSGEWFFPAGEMPII